jgi:hypothetical protein
VTPELARYRRLTSAYPRWHRRLHGDDMVTMLADAHADGRPLTRRRAVAYVLDGLACRLRVRGTAAVAFALVAAFVGAGLLAGLAGWATWRVTAAPMPTEARAADLAAPVLPAGPHHATRLVPLDRVLLPLIGDPEWEADAVEYAYVRPGAADPGPIPVRLTSAGWRVGSEHGLIVATRGRIRLTVLAADRDATTSDLIVTVRPVPPPAAYAVATVAAFLGALLGWAAAAAGVNRTRHQHPTRRSVARTLGAFGLVATLPAAAVNLLATAIANGDGWGAPPWVGIEVFGARPAAAVGLVLLVVARQRSLDTEALPVSQAA